MNNPVTVIGLGPMGQAMAAAFLAEGHPVTVWNRSPERAAPLVERGAVLAATPAEAVAASDLVVLSLTDYAAMYAILDGVGEALAGRVVANLSSDSPAASREAAGWLADRGARLLTGGVMVPAPVVGTDAAYVFYSGPRDALEAHRETLSVIGRPDYRGEDPALAQLWYQALLDIFLTNLSAFTHAAALLGSGGVPAADLVAHAESTADLAKFYYGRAAAHIDKREYPDEGANVLMMGATADHIVAASRDAGVDLALPRAVQAHYRWAVERGHGRDGWASLYEGVRQPS